MSFSGRLTFKFCNGTDFKKNYYMKLFLRKKISMFSDPNLPNKDSGTKKIAKLFGSLGVLGGSLSWVKSLRNWSQKGSNFGRGSNLKF